MNSTLRSPLRNAPSFLVALIAACGDGGGGNPGQAPWLSVVRADLSGPGAELLARADEARTELGTRLVAELTGAISSGGPTQAIGVCQERAPVIAAEVSEKHGVRTGRTSAQLRQPNNKAPEWARELLLPEAPTDIEEHVELRGTGDLRALFPILAAPICLQCHGAADELAPGVSEALAARYPDDNATGFAAGDLRGWFWVEVGDPAGD